jgi:hypothetical protein
MSGWLPASATFISGRHKISGLLGLTAYLDTINVKVKMYIFYVHVTVHRVKFSLIKLTRFTNFSNLSLE